MMQSNFSNPALNGSRKVCWIKVGLSSHLFNPTLHNINGLCSKLHVKYIIKCSAAVNMK